MNQYELGMVFRSSLTEEEVNSAIEVLKSRIVELGGEVTGVNYWGKRRLAYTIRKQTEGIYSFLNFSLSPQSVKELMRTVQFTETILRYILVKNEKKTRVKMKDQSEATPVEVKSESIVNEPETADPETTNVQTPTE